jgi:hypothetical protein
MKLEVGKKYLSRDNRIYTVTDDLDDCYEEGDYRRGRHRCRFIARTIVIYAEDGTSGVGMEKDTDLISEYTPKEQS